MPLTVAGRQVRDPVEIWRGYADRARTLREYDLAGTGDPAILVAGEVARSRIIASRISRQECAWFLQRAAGAPWSQVSVDADLACADPADRGGLFDAAAALYWRFTTPHQAGIGPAKIHKVLHVKRPRLYPVLDRLVRACPVSTTSWRCGLSAHTVLSPAGHIDLDSHGQTRPG